MRLGIVAFVTEQLTSSEKGRRRRGGPSSFLSAMRALMAIDYDPLTLPRVKSPIENMLGGEEGGRDACWRDLDAIWRQGRPPDPSHFFRICVRIFLCIPVSMFNVFKV